MTVNHNGQTYELLVQAPNWATPPQWNLQWRRETVTALQGREDRADFRRYPMATFQWTISRADVTEWAELEDQIDYALRNGLAAVPLWTRPSAILPGGTLRVDAAGIAWRGRDLDDADYAYTAWADGSAPQVREVTAYAPLTGTITLNGAIGGDAENLYPLVFGRLEVEKDNLQTDTHADLTLNLIIPEWHILIGPVVISTIFTVLDNLSDTVLQREFYFSNGPLVGGEIYPLNNDGELLGQIYFYPASAAAPEAGAQLVSFRADGVARQAWAKPL